MGSKILVVVACLVPLHGAGVESNQSHLSFQISSYTASGSPDLEVSCLAGLGPCSFLFSTVPFLLGLLKFVEKLCFSIVMLKKFSINKLAYCYYFSPTSSFGDLEFVKKNFVTNLLNVT